MREILTILAGLLVLLLTTALVGPYFVDWSQQRAEIDSRISAFLGAQATTEGPIGLTLLPIPTLTLAGLKLSGADATDPALATGAVSLELALTSLMHGEFRFTEAKVDTPRLTVTLGPDGSLAVPSLSANIPTQITFERLRVFNGSIHVNDTRHRRTFDIDAIDLDAQVDGLNGPYKGTGAMGLNGNPVAFRFQTSTRDGDRLRVKIIADESARLPRTDLEGALVFATGPTGSSRLRYDGNVVLTSRLSVPGVPTVPWRIAAAASIDPQRAHADTIDVQVGDEDRILAASGTADWAFGDGQPARIDLAAKQLDVDRFFAAGDDPSQAAARLTAAVAALAGVEPARRSAVPVALTLTAPTVLLGGDTLTGLALGLQTTPGQPVGLKLALAGPGRARLDLDGSVETGAAALFRGHAGLGARDMPRFADWLTAAAPDVAVRLKTLPFRSLDLDGNVEVSSVSFVGRALAIKADRSALGGVITYTSALGSNRARLFADLNADALDLDGVPDLTGPGAASAGIDLSLALNARAVRLARVGDGLVDAGRIAVKLTRTADRLQLENFSIADLGGASLTATGEAGNGTARGDLRLDAARLGDLADLIRRVAPGPGAAALASRATALSPARLTFHAEATTPAGAPWQIRALSLDGTLRGSHLVASVQPGATGTTAARFSLDSADTPVLIRQIGGASLALSNLGPSHIVGAATGTLAAGFEASLDATLANTDLTFRGRLNGALSDLHAAGSLRLKSGNINPLAQILAVALPDATAGLPADFAATVDVARDRVVVSGLAGQLAALPLRGDLVYAPGAAADTAQVTGELAFDRVSFGSLAALALGPQQPIRAGTPWSDTRFGAALADPPRTDLKITAATFDWAEGWSGPNATMRLQIAPGLVALNDISSKLGGADLSGHVALRRDGGAVALAGQAALRGLRLDRPSARGTVSGTLDFTATGTSPRGLAAGLAGTGKAHIEGIEIPRLDPGALDRVRAAADADRLTVDEPSLRSTLTLEFDKAALGLPPLDADLGMAGGVLRLTLPEAAQEIRVGPVTVAPSLTLDWRSLTIDQRVTLASLTTPKDWGEAAAPYLIVTWKGPTFAPQRDLEAGSFINGLSSRAIARETKRVEALDADIRERAFFNRRLKASRYLDQRDREIKAFLDAQARQQALDRLAAQANSAPPSGPLPPSIAPPLVLPGAAPPGALPNTLAPP